MRKGYIYRHWIVNDKGQEKSYIGQTAKNNPRERDGDMVEVDILAKTENSILINTYPSMEKALHSIGMIGHTQMVKAIKDNTIYKGYYWSRQE